MAKKFQIEQELNREKCQKFTSGDLVSFMLDKVKYKDDIYGKKILENSFGEGAFLKEIVERYITYSLKSGKTNEEIAIGLQNDIYGFEIDKDLYHKTIELLNEIATYYGIENISWSLFNANALTWKDDAKFDFVVGNPPYLCHQDISPKTRTELRNKYVSCSVGKFDYCYAFIEDGFSRLNDKGRMVQLVPTSIYKNVFGKELRNILIDSISEIIEYPDEKKFNNALTVSSIFVLDKNKRSNVIRYKSGKEKTKSINKNNLGDKWFFEDNINIEGKKFGELFKASAAVATQLNGVFVIDYKTVECLDLEKGSYRSATSPKNQHYNNDEYIIFPYYYRQGKVQRYSENKFREKFPNTYEYLHNNIKALKNRKSDKNAKFFEYGRSQALAHLNSKKLIMSTIITNEIKIYNIPVRTIPYSGIYIVPKSNIDLCKAKQILESKDFLEYVKNVGNPVNGKSIRITSKDVENYVIQGEV